MRVLTCCILILATLSAGCGDRPKRKRPEGPAIQSTSAHDEAAEKAAVVPPAPGNGETEVDKKADAAPPAKKPEPEAAPLSERIKLGGKLFKRKKCNACHKTKGYIATQGPNLRKVGKRLSRQEMFDWIDNPHKLKPKTLMPVFDGTKDQLELILDYLQSLK